MMRQDKLNMHDMKMGKTHNPRKVKYQVKIKLNSHWIR